MGARSVQPRTVAGRHIVVADPAMADLYERVQSRVGRVQLPVLLRGESGSGKEILAHWLHESSSRGEGPFIAINCAALPEHLVESELFGYVAGAFSGAEREKAGLFEAADGGTLFLDEVAELSPNAQAKLLRVLDDRRVRRLGETTERPLDVRIVAATYRNLERAVRRRKFRRDLYFRFKGVVLHIPPLRERPRELELLARTFVEQHAERAGLPPPSWSPAGLRALREHRWPGNIRELAAACGHLVATVESGGEIHPEHLHAWTEGVPEPHATSDIGTVDIDALPRKAKEGPFRPIAEEIAELERTRMKEALEAAKGNRTLAAQLISMPQRTFTAKLRTHALVR
ncbi:MAG: sigma 54-interacting transcriptional regulator [Myxococcota bacterium]